MRVQDYKETVSYDVQFGPDRARRVRKRVTVGKAGYLEVCVGGDSDLVCQVWHNLELRAQFLITPGHPSITHRLGPAHPEDVVKVMLACPYRKRYRKYPKGFIFVGVQ